MWYPLKGKHVDESFLLRSVRVDMKYVWYVFYLFHLFQEKHLFEKMDKIVWNNNTNTFVTFRCPLTNPNRFKQIN